MSNLRTQKSYYDLVVDINSLESLGQISLKKCSKNGEEDLVIDQKGWVIDYDELGLARYKEYIKKDTMVFGILGNANRGKTFFLQKMAGQKLGDGYSIQTKGISLKFPEEEEKNFVLLDSAGFETPLLRNILPKDCGFEDNANNTNKIEAIKKIAKDKLLTERFLQDFILHNSDIVIVIVNLLTYQEQKLLKRIKNRCREERKRLFVIHNLSTFVEVEQVKSYIKNTLTKSLTFNLTEMTMTLIDEKIDPTKQNTKYFSEKLNDGDDCDYEVNHYIMANDYSNAGKFYNASAIMALQIQVETFVSLKHFDVVEEIKKYLIRCSQKYMTSPLDEDSIIADIDERIIRLKKETNEIELKECLLDEMGIESLFDKDYKPNYIFYQETNDQGNWFVVVLEITGKLINVKQKVKIVDTNYIFKIWGEKERNSLVEGDSSSSLSEGNIKYGNFSVNFARKIDDNLQLKSMKIKKMFKKNGYLPSIVCKETITLDTCGAKIKDYIYYTLETDREMLHLYTGFGFALGSPTRKHNIAHSLKDEGYIEYDNFVVVPEDQFHGHIYFGGLPSGVVQRRSVRCKASKDLIGWACDINRMIFKENTKNNTMVIMNYTYFNNAVKEIIFPIDAFYFFGNNTIFRKLTQEKKCSITGNGEYIFFNCDYQKLFFDKKNYFLLEFDGIFLKIFYEEIMNCWGSQCITEIKAIPGKNKMVLGNSFLDKFVTNFDYEKRAVEFFDRKDSKRILTFNEIKKEEAEEVKQSSLRINLIRITFCLLLSSAFFLIVAQMKNTKI